MVCSVKILNVIMVLICNYKSSYKNVNFLWSTILIRTYVCTYVYF